MSVAMAIPLSRSARSCTARVCPSGLFSGKISDMNVQGTATDRLKPVRQHQRKRRAVAKPALRDGSDPETAQLQ